MNKKKEVIDISIIIPMFNVEKYIEHFLKCLLEQTIQNFVAIVIDDKSTDMSLDLLIKYKDLFQERLVVIENKKNLGLSASRNVGLAYVHEHKTKYVTFLDPDDWIENEYLEDLYKNAETYNLDLSISGLVRFNEADDGTICLEMNSLRKDVIDEIKSCDELAIINPCVYAKLFRYEPIEKVTFRNILRSEDTCYLFECLNVYKRIKFTNNAKYHYRVRRDSLSGQIGEDKYESMHKVFNELLSELKSSGSNTIIEQLVCQIFIRSSIGGVCRICFSNMRMCLSMERREYSYLESQIPEWRGNKYLDVSWKHGMNKKIMALKVCSFLYKIHCFSLFIVVYYFFNQVLGKDIRT